MSSELAQPGPRPTPGDEPLMLGVRAGDLAAFEQLVLRYQAAAWRVACRFTGDAAQAEDLTQDAFPRILDAAPPPTCAQTPSASIAACTGALLTLVN